MYPFPSALLMASLSAPVSPIANATTLSPKYKNPAATLSNGNLTLTATASAYCAACSKDAKASGRWYFEATIDALPTGGEVGIGVVDYRQPLDDYAGHISGAPSGQVSSNSNATYRSTGSMVTVASPIGTWAVGDVISIDYDAAAGTFRARRNGGTWSSAFNISDGSGNPKFPWAYAYGSGASLTLNFGATAFTYTPPGGALAWVQNAAATWRYFRYYVHTATSNQVNVAEFEASETVGGTNFFTGGSPTASSVFSTPTYTADKAVDGNNSTLWHCGNGAAGGAWWQYDLGSGNAKAFAEVRHRIRSDVLEYSSQFKYLVSNDGTVFYPLYGITNTTWTLGENRTIDF